MLMNDEYYWKNIEKLARMKDELNRSRASWFRHLTLVASSVFAIQVVFRGSSSSHSILQILASSLLILCILCSVTASWFEVYSLNRRAIYFHQELQRSHKANRKAAPVYGHKPVIFSVAEVVAIVSFVASCILLLV